MSAYLRLIASEKLTPAQKEVVKKYVTAMRPIAKEFIDELDKSIKTTKDNYGKVMSFISGMKPTQAIIFLRAMVEEGYPQTTASQIESIMGWN